MEEGYSENIFSPPFHPYSENLLDSIPEPYPDSKFLESRKENAFACISRSGKEQVIIILEVPSRHNH